MVDNIVDADVEDADVELSEEEKQKIIDLFKSNTNSFAYEELKEKLNQLGMLMQEIEQLSERIGIPFDTDISPISNTYTPASMYQMYGKLDDEDLDSLLSDLGVWIDSDYREFGGWEHSAIC